MGLRDIELFLELNDITILYRIIESMDIILKNII